MSRKLYFLTDYRVFKMINLVVFIHIFIYLYKTFLSYLLRYSEFIHFNKDKKKKNVKKNYLSQRS